MWLMVSNCFALFTSYVHSEGCSQMHIDSSNDRMNEEECFIWSLRVTQCLKDWEV